jgi:hypothetical protein
MTAERLIGCALMVASLVIVALLVYAFAVRFGWGLPL